MRRVVALAVLVMVLAMIGAGPADAFKRNKGQYAISESPYWRVGQLDRKLSSACRRGEFGQKFLYRLTVGFTGDRGRALTGIATSTWNLDDPKKLAQPNTTYHFFNQGYSYCKVYTWPTPRRN